MSDLYNAEIAGPFKALCGGSTDNDGSQEDCLSIAELANGAGYAVGDTKLGEGGPILRYNKAELVNGARQILAMFGEGDTATVA
jgi:hypothetical protein